MNVSGPPPRSITFHVAFSDKLPPKTWGLWGQRYSNRRRRQTLVWVLIKRDVQTTPAASDADSQGGWLPLPLPLKQIVLKIWHDMLSDSARRWRNMFTRCVNPIISQHYLLFPSDTKKYISNSVCIVLFFKHWAATIQWRTLQRYQRHLQARYDFTESLRRLLWRMIVWAWVQLKLLVSKKISFMVNVT